MSDCESDYLVRNIRLQEELAELKAKIYALMLEYCQEEMTTEQMTNWEAHQTPMTIAEQIEECWERG